MCATCHGITDPVGLAFEQFDGIGRFRTTENNIVIDPSGSLDDQPFADALGLVQELHDHPDLVACLSETALRYAQGHGLSLGEAELAAWHAQGMPADGFRWKSLLTELIAADSFTVAAAELSAGEVP
jgi:small ligand-binding sensory domain FIST